MTLSVAADGPSDVEREVRAAAGRALVEIDELVAAICATYVSRSGDPTPVDGPVGRRTRRILVLLLEATRSGRTVTVDEVRPLLGITLRSALAADLAAMLDSYRTAGRLLWQTLLKHPVEAPVLAELSFRWMTAIDVLTAAAATAHADASRATSRATDARRRELVESLLALPSPDTSELAVRFSTELGPAYTPVLVVGEAAGSRIEEMFARSVPGTLAAHRDSLGARDRVLLLVPGEPDMAAWEASDTGDTLAVLGSCSPVGPPLMRAVQAVDAAARAALAAGTAAGKVGPDDLLVARLLAADPTLAGRLRTQLERLLRKDSGGVLTETLQTYLTNGSVPETARVHDVHPNTVAYRLGRVQTLTGLDPRVPQQAVQLVLALTPTGAVV